LYNNNNCTLTTNDINVENVVCNAQKGWSKNKQSKQMPEKTHILENDGDGVASQYTYDRRMRVCTNFAEGGRNVKRLKQRKRARDTHELSSTEGGTSQNTKRKLDTEGNTLSVGCRVDQIPRESKGMRDTHGLSSTGEKLGHQAGMSERGNTHRLSSADGRQVTSPRKRESE
jgi:hypothetical protein